MFKALENTIVTALRINFGHPFENTNINLIFYSVILKERLMSSLNFLKIDVNFKIIIRSMINHY
jgi:hypothetical protein